MESSDTGTVSSGIEVAVGCVIAKHIPVSSFRNRFNVSQFVMSTCEPTDQDVASNGPDEAFNGAELSESVLGRDWNSPEEDATWSNL